MDRATEILNTYLRVTQHISQQMRIQLGKVSLTFPQAMLLSVLDREGALPIGTLAQMTSSANSTISGVVDRLESMGLVQRRRSGSDRRVIYVETTSAYHRLRSRAAVTLTEKLERLLSPMSDEEQDALLHALARLDETLQAVAEE